MELVFCLRNFEALGTVHVINLLKGFITEFYNSVIYYFFQLIIMENNKNTNRKIRKTEFLYICGSKNGSTTM